MVYSRVQLFMSSSKWHLGLVLTAPYISPDLEGPSDRPAGRHSGVGGDRPGVCGS